MRALCIGLSVCVALVGTACRHDRTQPVDPGPTPRWSDGCPSWSRDGSRLVFASNRHAPGYPEQNLYDLYSVSVTGRRVERLTNTPTSEADPAVARDGTLVAFTRARPRDGVMNERPDLVVAAFPPAGRARVVVRAWSDSYISSPSWSPDGRELAFSSGLGIAVVDIGSRRVRELLERGGTPAWSPDGRSIAFASFVPEEAVALVRTDGTGLEQVTDPEDPGDYEPSWSPDGTRIAFQRSGDIAVVTLDGGHVERLTTTSETGNGDGCPAWSPDGTSIAFTRSFVGGLPGEQLSAIYVVRPDGTGLRRLTQVGP